MFRPKYYRNVSTFFYTFIVKQLQVSVRFRAHDQSMSTPGVSDFQSPCLQRNAGDRKFYSLPDDYGNISNPDVTTESSTLLNEIYSNISSRSARFHGPFGKRSVIYCDYAASGQPLNFIEDYIKSSVLPFYGNTHTTTTATSLQSTYFRHESKDIIRKAVNASEHDAVIFTGSGSTGAVNKLVHALNFQAPVVIFVGPYEHHSNILPWREMNAKVVRIKETKIGLVDIAHLEEELTIYSNKGYHLIGSFSAASNVTGILTDDISISVLLHKYGALSFWDYAAAGPYVKINMNPVIMGQDEGLAYKDALFLSPHKFVGGPDTPGILIAKKILFHNAIPREPGGGTIFFVTRDTHRYLKDVEMREEGGTPSIVGAVRAGMAFQLKEAVGVDVIKAREYSVFRRAIQKWQNIPQLKILGSTLAPRLPIFSFVIYHSVSGLYLHHNFVCALLNDMFGIQTRSGCACAGPYALDLLGIDEPLAQKFDALLAENSSLDRTHLRRQGEYSECEVLRPGFVRLTLPYFMSDEDIDFVINAVCLVADHGWKMLLQYSFNPETGEWKHKSQQIFVSRKWLGAISYKTGVFKVEESNMGDTKESCEILEEAKVHFQNSKEAALKKFTPDQQLIFDNKSAKFRWFLLPSEAKHCMMGTFGKVKSPVFIVRTEYNQLNPFDVKENISSDNSSQVFMRDENSNMQTSPEPTGARPLQEFQRNRLILERECHVSPDVIGFISKVTTKSTEPKCKWHSPPSRMFKNFLKAVDRFQMIRNGDKVLVCVSGGKDSLSLLHTLHQFQFYARSRGINFQFGAMTVDPKSPLYDPSPMKDYMKALNVQYFYEEQDIVGQAASMDKCKSICSFCSRMKRGRIYACAQRGGFNVIALGQHLDDLAESFLMSIFHNGRLRTMKAHYLDRTSSLRIIRPFAFLREKELRNFAEEKKLPVIPENCPSCFEAPKERHRMKQLLAAQEVQFPNVYQSLKQAMLPLMAISAAGIEDQMLGKEAVDKTGCGLFLLASGGAADDDEDDEFDFPSAL